MNKFDPHSNEWLIKKFEIYKNLREQDTAYWSDKYKMFVFTRYADVHFILNNPNLFSSSKGNLIVEHLDRFGKTLGASDNPTHDVYKNIVKDAYSKNNIKRVSDLFAEKANEHFSDKSELNISEITEDLSAWVVAEIINGPLDKKTAKDIIIDTQRNNPLAVQNGIPYHKAYVPYLTCLSNKEPAPGPGIYNDYLNNKPEKLDVFSLIAGPMISGASSLTGALQFLTLDLYRENQLDILLNDRSLIPNAVNESLRFHASTGRFSRTVTQEFNLHDINLKPGNRVAACLESANRDPNKFPNPDKFDIYRDTTGQLAWGHGVHACIALAISRAILCSYLEILLDKIGKYEILTKNEDLKYIMTYSGNDDMISNLIMRRV
jgi:cytochrome P450